MYVCTVCCMEWTCTLEGGAGGGGGNWRRAHTLQALHFSCNCTALTFLVHMRVLSGLKVLGDKTRGGGGGGKHTLLGSMQINPHVYDCST